MHVPSQRVNSRYILALKNAARGLRALSLLRGEPTAAYLALHASVAEPADCCALHASCCQLTCWSCTRLRGLLALRSHRAAASEENMLTR